MVETEAFRQELIKRIPDLVKFARSLTKNVDTADDLVQDTLLLSYDKVDEFIPGSNMVAWLFTLMRFIHSNALRREVTKRKYLESNAGLSEAQLPDQIDRLILEEARQAFDELPVDQRSALFLIVYDGRSYGEAAQALGCSVGTVKSRVSRARAAIAKKLDMDHTGSAGHEAPEQGM